MKYTLILLLLLCCSPLVANAQRDTTGPHSKGCFPTLETPLAFTPPLHTDMPLKTLYGYIWFDSLLRSTASDASFDSIIQSITSYDTMKYFESLLYSMIDYDPMLFRSVISTGAFQNPLYHHWPGRVIAKVQQRADSILGPLHPKNCLTNADYVLHIHVTSTINDVDSDGSFPISPLPLHCIEGQVLDIVKGQRLPPSSCFLFSAQKALDEPPCLHFQNLPYRQKKLKTDLADTYRMMTMPDGSVRYPSNIYGDSAFVGGHDYIVFLNITYIGGTVASDYYNIDPLVGYETSGGVYPITSGQVSDPTNYWGWGTSVPLPTFLANLRTLAGQIINP